ncbi:RNA polymerase factor sigma-54 [Jeotgalibacillus soli]|uniref:RNA polymerase sigma-54 factor n=1 Tax=Jeotgalibacillus soli TaxID=889306 RepID=A0A0C2W3J0_9BACL|nr:RNA polymerase factor sigma-54 [Jeotgalibacillus soli]KIL50628.1 hypothetical protein KP78_06290 [Jeotgalibacillus soli]
MNLSTGLLQQQTTNLTMTQGLRQAISLLQYSLNDLSDFIQEQAMDNPLIELHDNARVEAGNEGYSGKSKEYAKRSVEDTNQAVSPFDYINMERRSLQEHLLNQICLLQISDMDYKLLSYFIYHINEDGYLSHTVEELCQELKVSDEKGKSLLTLIQELDPVGVGARNLQECLLLQLEKMPTRNRLAECIVAQHIAAFASKSWKSLSKELSVTLQEIQQVQDLIHTLQPRPGINYSSELPKYIVADVSVMESNGTFTVVINDELLPIIKLNHEYQSLLKQKNVEAHQYLKEKYGELQWLQKSILQRHSTLYQVTKAIVDYQQDFFVKGPAALKPLTLKQIAEEIDVHESTVSRITSNKYVETPTGIVELKYFFSSSLIKQNNETSSTSVKELIKNLIDKEDKTKPLSDQKIVQMLEKKQQIQISRRAIAKYRDEMNIPSSPKRKRFLAH